MVEHIWPEPTVAQLHALDCADKFGEVAAYHGAKGAARYAVIGSVTQHKWVDAQGRITPLGREALRQYGHKIRP
jgi:hypothetical protein